MRYALLAASTLACLPALATSIPASAAPFVSGTGAYSVVASCPGASPFGACPTVPETLPLQIIGSYPYVEDLATTPFALTSSASAIATYGTGLGTAASDGETTLPLLRALAATPFDANGIDSVAYGSASALFAYTYTGATAVAFPLVGVADFSITYAPIDFGNPLAPGSFPYSSGAADLRLVVGTSSFYTGAFLFPSVIACGQPGVLASSTANPTYPGFTAGGVAQTVSFSIDTATGCDGNPLMLEPGQQIYVHAFLGAYAQRGAVIDAQNTFRIDLADTISPETRRAILDNLQLSVVPEPDTWGLLIAGFGLTGAMMRRRRIVAA